MAINISIESLHNQFIAADWGELDLDMIDESGKRHGSVQIVPCFDYTNIKAETHVEYFLMGSPDVNLYGENTLDAVVKSLRNFDALVSASETEKIRLQDYFDKYIKDRPWDQINPDRWGWYSDWHKDVYGYRPHGSVCGQYIRPY